MYFVNGPNAAVVEAKVFAPLWTCHSAGTAAGTRSTNELLDRCLTNWAHQLTLTVLEAPVSFPLLFDLGIWLDRVAGMLKKPEMFERG